MGAKHSKPRIRRSGRFRSTGKRQAPEGSNDPVPVVNESWKQNIADKSFTGTQHDEKNCDFCRPSEKNHDQPTFEKYDHSKIGDVFTNTRQNDFRRDLSEEKTSFLDDLLTQTNLKVELPQSPACCRNYKAIDKSKSLPPKATLNDSTKLSNKDEEEWTITLYEIDNKVQGRVPREDMVRLMSSIYDAVDNKIGEVPQGRKTVKVQLSVTPERRSQSKVTQQRTSSALHREQSECRCQECPKTEPPNRRSANESHIRRHKSDASPRRFQAKQASETPTNTQKGQNPWRQRSFRDHSAENKDRRRHYANLEGLDSTNQNRIASKESSFANNNGRSKDAGITKSRTLPNYEERHQEKVEKGANSKRRLRCHENNNHRSALQRLRRKDPRFASPYDQHFQEAMYLRLRELQRQGANEVRRATGRLRDSDEADDDSDSDVEKRLTNKNEKSILVSNSDDDKLSNCKNRKNGVTNSKSSSDAVSVHHHHHYHHGLPEGSFLSTICSTEPRSIKQSPDSLNSSNSGDATTHHHYHHHYHHAEKS